MKDCFNISVIQLAPEALKVDENISKINTLIKNNISIIKNTDLLILPEYFSLGVVNNLELKAAKMIEEKSKNYLKTLAEDYNTYVSGGTMPEVVDNNIYNTSFFYDRSSNLIAFYRKIHLYSYDDFNENGVFQAGQDIVLIDTEIARIGMGVCYDLRFPKHFRELRKRGAEIFIVPATWDYPFMNQWEPQTKSRAIENQSYLVAANISSTDYYGPFIGRSMLINYKGDVIAALDGEEGVLSGQICLERLYEYRDKYRYYKDMD